MSQPVTGIPDYSSALDTTFKSPATDVKPVAPRVAEVAIPAVPASKAPTFDKIAATSEQAVGEPVAYLSQPRLSQFSLVGVTWDVGTQQDDEITVLVRSFDSAGWSDWTELDIDSDEGPSAQEEAIVQMGTQPAWVGNSSGVEVAVFARDGVSPRNLQLSTIDPGVSAYDAQLVESKNAYESEAEALRGPGPLAGTFPGMPVVVSRQEWGADDSLRDKCWDPRFGKTFKLVFVHHTAGSNDYEESESAAVVRGIYSYYVVSRGWCDIGYNFLVDRYGNVFEGRSGGTRMPVRGAHSGDYNVDTTGISMMGNFDQEQPRRPMKHALVQLIAWRLGAAYHGAYGRVIINGDRFARISGHRDAMSTSCPGQYAYDWLPTLRQRVHTRLGNYVSMIEETWRAAGGKDSALGVVKVGEQGENGGRHTTFTEGRMYNSRAGIFKLYRGPILSRYKRADETDGALGYPRSPAFAAGQRTGLAAQFQGGRIYWSEATASRMLFRSPVLSRYLVEEGPRGALGFPTSAIVKTKNGHHATFQHGRIAYHRTTKETSVRLS
ncbi:MAG: N-acetylmuramoyl-L-alanine amidase [Nocardioidaceae bacterium]